MDLDYSDEFYADLNRMILEVALCDFEPYESILENLSRKSADKLSVCTKEMPAALLSLVADGLIGAYMIHADPPYITAVEPNLETIQRYWFIISAKGKRYLQDTSDRRARVFHQ